MTLRRWASEMRSRHVSRCGSVTLSTNTFQHVSKSDFFTTFAILIKWVTALPPGYSCRQLVPTDVGGSRGYGVAAAAGRRHTATPVQGWDTGSRCRAGHPAGLRDDERRAIAGPSLLSGMCHRFCRQSAMTGSRPSGGACWRPPAPVAALTRQTPATTCPTDLGARMRHWPPIVTVPHRLDRC